MMQVAICTDGIFPLEVGGMQRHSRNLIESLSRFPDLTLHVLHPHPKKLFTDFSNVKEYPLEGIRKDKIYLIENWKYSKRIAQTLKEINPDVIYSQGLSVWSDIEVFSKKLIVNPHGLEPYQGLTQKDRLTGIPFRLVFEYIFKRSAVVISLGGKLTKILKSIVKSGNSRIEVIPNATHLSENVNPVVFSKSSVQILFVGRFAANKGIGILMDAIEKLHKPGQAENLVFKLAGKGPLFEMYSQNSKLENVSFPGFVSDEELAELYQNSQLFVLPTLFEGMPTVVLEAMAHGLPVAVSDVGATSELVDSTNGFLLPKGNSDALVNALAKFSQLPPEQKAEMGKRSIEKVKTHFNWKSVSQQYYELFSRIASGN